MNFKFSLFLIPALSLSAACSQRAAGGAAEVNNPPSVAVKKPVVISGKVPSASAIPAATAFRINPEYADKVAITVGSDGKLSYFPAPTDITDSSAPLDLGDGWWLNRQGIAANSVFTTFTFSRYRALQAAPSPRELLEAVIPGSGISEMVKLPYNINEAPAHIPEIKTFLKKL